jgi:hypothetical protein
MRQFFVLNYCSRDHRRYDLECVSRADLGSFRVTALWDGKRFEGHFPKDYKLWVTGKTPSDLLANPHGVDIVSERFLKLLQEHSNAEIQVIQPPLYREGTNEPVSGYHLINVIGCIEAIAEIDGQKKIMVTDMVFDGKRIPPDVHLFRPCEAATLLILSGELVEKLHGQGLRGVSLIKTDTV